MAHALGAANVSLTSGRAVPGTPPEKAVEFLKHSLRELLPYAEKHNVRLGIEYEPGLLVERYGELFYLIEEMDSPYLGANLDLGHSHVLGEDPKTVISGLSQKIFHVHLEDILARKHYHLIPGLGDVPFQTLFSLLDQCGFKGFVTVELYTYPHEPEEAARKSLDYLQRLLLQAGKGPSALKPENMEKEPI